MKPQQHAAMVRQYSHVVATFIRLCEPSGKQMWADAQLQLVFEDLGSGQKIPLMMLSAMLLYPGANYAHACHLSHLERAINEIDDAVKTWLRSGGGPGAGSTTEEVDQWLSKMPAKGAVAVDVRTMVPKTQAGKIRYGIQFFANDGTKPVDLPTLIRATNIEMVRQLGLAIKDIYAKASPASAMTATQND